MRASILLVGACVCLGCASEPSQSSKSEAGASKGEGAPCSIDNGNRDCDVGLYCFPPPNPLATTAPDVCCPRPGGDAAPTASACTVTGSIDAGNPGPPDGPSGGGAVDGG